MVRFSQNVKTKTKAKTTDHQGYNHQGLDSRLSPDCQSAHTAITMPTHSWEWHCLGGQITLGDFLATVKENSSAPTPQVSTVPSASLSSLWKKPTHHSWKPSHAWRHLCITLNPAMPEDTHTSPLGIQLCLRTPTYHPWEASQPWGHPHITPKIPAMPEDTSASPPRAQPTLRMPAHHPLRAQSCLRILVHHPWEASQLWEYTHTLPAQEPNIPAHQSHNTSLSGLLLLSFLQRILFYLVIPPNLFSFSLESPVSPWQRMLSQDSRIVFRVKISWNLSAEH